MPEQPHKTAVVTGASQGIGNAIARAFAAAGIRTILAGRSMTTLERARNAMQDATAPLTCLSLDLLSAASIEAFADAVGHEVESLDILVNCAGSYRRGALEDETTVEFDALYDTNVKGVFNLTRSLLPLLKAAEGDIVFINSSVVFSDGRDVGLYAATHGAMRAIADALRAEVNADGVRVLTVFPGRTASPLQETIFAAEGRDYAPDRLLQGSDIAEAVLASISLPRTAEVTELSIRPRNKC